MPLQIGGQNPHQPFEGADAVMQVFGVAGIIAVNATVLIAGPRRRFSFDAKMRFDFARIALKTPGRIGEPGWISNRPRRCPAARRARKRRSSS
ncbi:MAG: hypothetical protein WDM86_07250 [Rhizomicrobium sp.]